MALSDFVGLASVVLIVAFVATALTISIITEVEAGKRAAQARQPR